MSDPVVRSLPTRVPPGSPVGAGQFASATLAGIAGVEVVFGLTSISIILGVFDVRRDTFAEGWMVGLELAHIGIYLLTVIAWMVWQAQSHANLRALAQARYSPSVVWFYLVPIAGLIIPYRAIAELARASGDRPALRRTWWALFITMNAFGGIATFIEPEITGRVLGLLSSIAAVIAAALAIRIIALVNTGVSGLRAQAGWPSSQKPLSRAVTMGWGATAATLAIIGAAGFGAMVPALARAIEELPEAPSNFAIGDCFNETTEEFVDVSCHGPHEAEIFEVLDHPDAPAYPGNQSIADWAEPQCYARFESYTGVAYPDSPLEFNYLYPTAQGWRDGDREVICYLFDPTGDDLTEPIANPA